jgi:hypothetical protein
MGLERGPLSLVRINEELLERKVAAPVQKTEINGRGGSAAPTTRHPSIRKSWQLACELNATEFFFMDTLH